MNSHNFRNAYFPSLHFAKLKNINKYLNCLILFLLVILISGMSMTLANIYFNAKVEAATRISLAEDIREIAVLALMYYNSSKIPKGGEEWNNKEFYEFSGYPVTSDETKIQTEYGQIELIFTSSNQLKFAINDFDHKKEFKQSIMAILTLNGYDSIKKALKFFN